MVGSAADAGCPFVCQHLADGRVLVMTRRMWREQERLAVAVQLAEYAAAAVPGFGMTREDAARVHAIRAKVLRAKQSAEPCLMSSSIYKAAARDSNAARKAVLAGDSKL